MKITDSIKIALDKNLPFVAYRKPNKNTISGFFQQNDSLFTTEDYREKGFVFAPFDDSNASILIPSSLSNFFKEEYVKEEFILNTDFVSKDTSEAFHISIVEKGIKAITEGDFKKVVLSRKEVVSKRNFDVVETFNKLLNTYQNAFVYVWFHPQVGLWLGATPEILLQLQNQQLTTMSLAGTKKYVENENPNWGSKELEEQELVTQYISNAIAGSVSELNILDRTSIKAGNLWHLRTKLTGTLLKGHLSKIVVKLHPTPAVCGMPMSATKAFIEKNENYNREYYTGYLGELNFKIEKDRTRNRRNQENKAYRSIKTNTTFFVNLRCMQLKNKIAQIYIGGGITHDSDPEKEWQETVAKSNTMLQVLATSQKK